MSVDAIKRILNHYAIDDLVGEPRPFVTGFQHTHWLITTNSGDYLVKKINPKVYHGYLQKHYLEYAERHAELFANAGIPLQHATLGKQGYVTLDNDDMYQVSKWIEGDVLSVDQLSYAQVYRMGDLLGQCHQANLSSEDYDEPPMWNEVLGSQYDREWQGIFRLACRSTYVEPVMSHRDIGPHNIVWQGKEPVLIDWENVGLIDKGLELMGVVINCIDYASEDPDLDRAYYFIDGYKSVAGALPFVDESHIIACSTSWLAWLGYLAERRHAEPTPINQTQMKDEVIDCFKALSFILQERDSLIEILTS